MIKMLPPGCLALLALLLAPAPVLAGPATDALSACLADNTTGKERKELAKWVFVGISSHPAMRDISRATPALREQVNQRTGAMLTRLLTENCPQQARRVIREEGGHGLEQSFSSLGKLAMQELMGNAEVNAAIGGFANYLDQEKLRATFEGR